MSGSVVKCTTPSPPSAGPQSVLRAIHGAIHVLRAVCAFVGRSARACSELGRPCQGAHTHTPHCRAAAGCGATQAPRTPACREVEQQPARLADPQRRGAVLERVRGTEARVVDCGRAVRVRVCVCVRVCACACACVSGTYRSGDDRRRLPGAPTHGHGTNTPSTRTAQHSTAQHSTAQHSTAQHSTAQHSTAQHSTAQHSTAQRSHTLLLRTQTCTTRTVFGVQLQRGRQQVLELAPLVGV
jgi:hypothetical protein